MNAMPPMSETNANGSIDSSGPKLVRSALVTQRVNSAQITGAVAHFKDDPGALSPFLDPEVFDRLVPRSAAEARTLECFSVAYYGVGFVAFTALKTAGAGEPPLRSVEMTRSPVVRELLGRLSRRTLLRPDSAVNELRATRPSRLGLTDRAVTEYLVKVPPPVAAEPEGLRVAACRIAGWVWEDRHALTFIHWPASPPAIVGAWRTAEGPCIRFAVASPRQAVGARLAFGRKLLERCVGLGYGLWIRQSGEPAGPYDYWRCLFSPDPAAENGPAADWRPAPAPHLAVTCVGPAHRGTTAAILRMLNRADVPVPALSVGTLDDLSFVHVVAGATAGSPGATANAASAVEPGEPATAALRRLFGLRPALDGPDGLDDPDGLLADFRVMATPYPAPGPAADKQSLWLAWSTPATHGALSLIVRSARAALTGALEIEPAGRSVARPSIEYLISRAVSVDRLRGRAKIALDLGSLGLPGAGTGDWLGRLCSEIERRWRADLSFTLGTPRVDLEVVWRESWLGRWSLLQRGELR
jgi:hypothetical protein